MNHLLAAVVLLVVLTTAATGHPFVCDGPTWPAFVVDGAWSCTPPGGLTA